MLGSSQEKQASAPESKGSRRIAARAQPKLKVSGAATPTGGPKRLYHKDCEFESSINLESLLLAHCWVDISGIPIGTLKYSIIRTNLWIDRLMG